MSSHTDIVRKVLLSDTAEQEMKLQMIRVAVEQLSQDGMPEVLLDAFETESITAIRNQLLDLLIGLDVSRFKDPKKLYSAFLDALKQGGERRTREKTVARLCNFIHHDRRIIPSIFESLAYDALSENEQYEIISAFNRAPHIDPEIVLLTIEKVQYAPTFLQETAIELALNLPSWNSDIVSALQPYLRVGVDGGLKHKIYKKLREVKVLDQQQAPELIEILRHDPDVALRNTSLELLASIRPVTAEVIIQYFWSAKYDADKGIRKTALRLQNNIPKLSKLEVRALVERLYEETREEVRIHVLENIRNYIRIDQVREAVLICFSEHPNIGQNEFDLIVNLLSPYITRDEKIRNRLLAILPTLPSVDQRKALVDAIIPVTRIELILDDVIAIFNDETNDALRSLLFNKLKVLSVSKHPSLIAMYSRELKEPGSPFRLECANAISAVSEISSQTRLAIEDVLLHDTDRELIRVALKAYLKPNVEKSFEVLIAVAEKELLDIQTRNEAVDEMMKMDISTEQKQRIENSLSNTEKQ